MGRRSCCLRAEVISSPVWIEVTAAHDCRRAAERIARLTLAPSGFESGRLENMKLTTKDLEYRRPVWEALSDLFLDTDNSFTHPGRIAGLVASPYSLDELERILIDEVYPVCGSNLFSIAGEWTGFDPQWLESSILRRLASPVRRFNFGRLIAPCATEWRHIRDAILQQRCEEDATNA